MPFSPPQFAPFRWLLAIGTLTVLTAYSTITCAQTAADPGKSAPTNPAAKPQSTRSVAWWTDAARLLAGLEPSASSELAALAQRAPVEQHRRAFKAAWDGFEKGRLAPAMAFARTEIAPLAAAKGPIYYPFSGPDAMYALALFPDATEFALAGLEPVGDLPDFTRFDDATLNASFAELRRSLNSIKAFSFFRTNDMRSEFGNNRFSGVTPILMLFIARHGYAINSVMPVVMEADASLREVQAGALRTLRANQVPGVQIRFQKPGEPRERTLYYFAADLSDQGLAKNAQALKWSEGFAPSATYLKSASYLMHKSYFSVVRGFIISRSALIVQDDSGIPLRFFADTAWDRTLYGVYHGPIPLFANWNQPDLRVAYQKQARSLDFGIGYDFQARTSNIQKFVRRGS